MTVAGGHRISAKIVSVNTISVTFTDEIDPLTNINADQCCKNHGDRTAVIDLLDLCGSSKYNNVKNKEYKAEKIRAFLNAKQQFQMAENQKRL